MRNLENVFDPSLTILFAKKLKNQLIPHQSNSEEGRYLFFQLNQTRQNPDVFPRAYQFISQGLNQSKKYSSAQNIHTLNLEKLASIKVTKFESIPDQLSSQENIDECLNQTAIILLTQPAWLENILQNFSCQTKIALDLMSLYHQLRQSNQFDNDNSAPLKPGIKFPNLSSINKIQQPEILPEIFDFAATQLALAQFPRLLFPEILGFTLAYCQMPRLIECCFPQNQLSTIYFNQRTELLNKQQSLLYQSISEYLTLFSQNKKTLELRIQQGYWLFQMHMQACRNSFQRHLENPLTTAEKVAELFQQKAIAAIGHHQKIQLKGQSLDQWFAKMPANNIQFLETLRQSAYVDKHNPENSKLLQLFDFKGPMFGVFDQTELTILKNWLNDETPNLQSTDSKKTVQRNPTPAVEKLSTKNNYAKLSNRELYYYLINADLFPEVKADTKPRLHKWLQLCKYSCPPPFKHYSHLKLDKWIENIYKQEIQAYQPLQGKPKFSKEAYIWGMEQIAPMILIDGCWLQNSLNLEKLHPDICEILFKIYWDESGNGQLQQNHPYIFQQLLDSLFIKLPPLHNKDFIKHSGFINSAFDLPVYMMLLSNYSVEYLPELLGLNMAIELSGLGKGYMRLVDELNYWDIDPSIASIHISIDNYASGHTFLAKKAIQIYMHKIIQSTADTTVIDKHWRRIHTGYGSLRLIGSRFKTEMPIRYLIQKFRPKNK